MKIKCLSMADAKFRRSVFEERFLNTDFQYIDAISPEEETEIPKPFQTAGEYGCYLSWEKICNQLLGSDDEYWLILEDDAIPTPRFDIKKLENEIPKHFDLIQLHCHKSAHTFDYDEFLDEVRPSSFCTVSGILSKSGARKWLELKNRKQVDLMFMEITQSDGGSFRVKKPMIRHDWSMGSQIKGNPSYTQYEINFHEPEIQLPDIFVLTLPWKTERQNKVTQCLVDANLDFSFRKSFWGESIWENPQISGANGCRTSHFSLWFEFFNKGVQEVIILEDDVVCNTTEKDLIEQIQNFRNEGADVGILYPHTTQHMGSWAYWINRNAMGILMRYILSPFPTQPHTERCLGHIDQVIHALAEDGRFKLSRSETTHFKHIERNREESDIIWQEESDIIW